MQSPLEYYRIKIEQLNCFHIFVIILANWCDLSIFYILTFLSAFLRLLNFLDNHFDDFSLKNYESCLIYEHYQISTLF